MQKGGGGFSIGSIVILIGIILMLRYYWRGFLFLSAGVVILILVLLLVARYFSAAGKAQSLADKGRYREALHIMAGIESPQYLMQFLRHKVPFPDSKTRSDLTGAAKELLTLRSLASDTGYPRLPASLRKSLHEETGKSLESLWNVCQHLALLTRQKIDPASLETFLEPIRAKVHQLVDAVNEARTEISRLTLGRLDALEDDVAGPIERVKWQINEMRHVETMLSSTPHIPPTQSKPPNDA